MVSKGNKGCLEKKLHWRRHSFCKEQLKLQIYCRPTIQPSLGAGEQLEKTSKDLRSE